MQKIIIFFAFIFSMVLTSCDDENFIIYTPEQIALDNAYQNIQGTWIDLKIRYDTICKIDTINPDASTYCISAYYDTLKHDTLIFYRNRFTYKNEIGEKHYDYRLKIEPYNTFLLETNYRFRGRYENYIVLLNDSMLWFSYFERYKRIKS